MLDELCPSETFKEEGNEYFKKKNFYKVFKIQNRQLNHIVMLFKFLKFLYTMQIGHCVIYN